MIRWLINLIRRRRARKARDLFAYFDGQRTRRVDPFAIEAALISHPTFTIDHVLQMNAGSVEAEKIVLQATCDVFSLRPWDPETETGLTFPEILGVFGAFDLYCEVVKKKYNLGPTSSEPTDSAPFNLPAVPSSTTNSPLDSIKTAGESSIDKLPA